MYLFLIITYFQGPIKYKQFNIFGLDFFHNEEFVFTEFSLEMSIGGELGTLDFKELENIIEQKNAKCGENTVEYYLSANSD